MLRQIGQLGDVGVRNIVRTIRGEAPTLGLQQGRDANSEGPQQPRGLDEGCHGSIGSRLMFWAAAEEAARDAALMHHRGLPVIFMQSDAK